MSGIPNMGRKFRAPTCHPNRMHHAKGLCKVCYQRTINTEVRSGKRIPRQRRATEWPQAVVKVPVPGWGYLG